MINPKELRIGNWILDHHNDTIEVESIFGGYVNPSVDMHFQEINGDAFDEINPIPITPEILEKCGFSKGRGALGVQYYWIGDFHIEEVDGGYELQGSEWTMGKTFANLHQLQNLYFALTGEEIEIKL